MDLTESAIWEILLRLPVRSLLRFRCVCKDWCTVIETSLFKDRYLALRRATSGVDEFIVLIHTLRSIWRDQSFLTCCYGDYESLALSVSAASSKDIDISGNHSCQPFFINHVNGIVCLTDIGFDGLNVTLCNPSLKELRKLPYPGFDCYPQAMGFGFDDATNDYKVVAIVASFCENVRKVIVLVYHLNTNSWNILGDMSVFVPELHWPSCCACIFSHGSIHWRVGWNSSNNRILTFNMTNELFQVIQFPPRWKDYDYSASPLICTFDESTIALVALTRQVHDVDVWVMKEYGVRESWTKQYSIRSLPSIMMPLCYWRKDKLLLKTLSRELICLLKGQLYQPEQCDPICLSDPDTVSLEFISCMESFVSVK